MAKPKLALIPAAQGSKLYSVLPSSGVGDFDFTRSGSATRINAQGLIETVGSGVSRLNYPMIDGVVKGCPHHILEPERRQLIQYSEDFSNAAWIKSNSSITSNSVISPDGTLNASTLTDNTANGIHRLRDSVSLSASTNYSLSVFAKKGTLSNIQLALINTSNSATSSRVFDLENGVLGESIGVALSDSKITDYGNGWFKCEITSQLSSTPNTYQITLATKSSGNATTVSQVTYDGDGSGNVYLYGAMLEEGSYSTSYIPNYGTALGVTRSAETANGSGDAATFNDSEGVLMAEISALDNDGTYKQILLHDNAYNNRIALRYMPISNQINAVLHNGSIQADFTYNLANALDFNKIAFKYKENDFALWVNGIEIDTDGTGTTFSANTLEKIDFDFINNYFFYGKTKQLQYFDTADIDLEQLTSWVSFQEMAEGQLYTIE